jgi:membrane protease YdiL (CAAX protease family)
MLTVPLFAFYELGLILFTTGTVRNAADVMLRDLFGAHGPRGALVLNGMVLLLFLVAALSRRRSRSSFACLPFLLAESACYAALLLPVTSLVVKLMAPSPVDPVAHLVLSIGAGLYEELLFRLLLVAGGYSLLHRGCKMRSVWAGCVAILLSSLLFSAYHHVGSGGEPLVATVFAFRFLAGVLLGWLFLLRGFAVVCWTHALYDVLCVL